MRLFAGALLLEGSLLPSATDGAAGGDNTPNIETKKCQFDCIEEKVKKRRWMIIPEADECVRAKYK